MQRNEILNEWLNNPITEWMFKELNARLTAFTEVLRQEAGQNPVEDARKSGRILEIQEILNIDFEEAT